MHCPYCLQTMEKGTIQMDCWVSNTENLKFPYLHKKVKLIKGWDSSPYIDAFYCESCKKIIIDLNT